MLHAANNGEQKLQQTIIVIIKTIHIYGLLLNTRTQTNKHPQKPVKAIEINIVYIRRICICS